MAVTNNLSLTQPTVGGDDGTWGTALNADWATVDQRFGGTLTKSGLTGGTTALTASEMQYTTIVCSGTLVSNATITFPLNPNSATVAIGGLFVVTNNTTGSFTLTVKTVASGSTGVTIPQGYAALVYSDGTNVSYAMNGMPGFAAACSGSPTGQLAGTQGSATTSASIAWDYTNSVLYVCTTTGTTSTAVWSVPTASPQLTTWTTGGRPSAAAGKLGYNSTLAQIEYYNGGSWVQAPQMIAGGYRSLVITNNSVTPNTQIDVDADAVTAEGTDGVAYRLRSVDLTINCATTGANGLDTGSLVANTWYSVWVIYNPTTATTAGLASTSATAPTLPSGYTAYARFGWMRTSASATLFRTIQKGNRSWYISGTNPSVPRSMASGDTGDSTPATAVAVANFVPTTASHIMGSLGGGNVALVAPNNTYGARTSSTNRPPSVGGTGSQSFGLMFEFMLESTSIYWGSSDSSANLYCLGWTDNI